jgi:beta-lactamase superfamily II metal-dependent hydrolase
VTELIILDVAHGNSALLVSGGIVAVFDAAPKDVLSRTMRDYQINTIDYLYISHWDQDHIGGLINLLSNRTLRIRNLIINSDSTKHGPQNQFIRILIDEAEQRYGLNTELAKANSPAMDVGEVSVKVLAPSTAEILSGAGGTDANGNLMDSNSVSVVLQLTHDNHNVALLTADIDQRSLDSLLQRGQPLHADILVFPHHGGNCAPNNDANAAFAYQLANLVQPQVTIFSMGREHFQNPRPEIVSAVRRAVPNTYIACTQLSTNCLRALPQNINYAAWKNHLSGLPGAGHDNANSCFGTLYLRLAGSATQYPKAGSIHSKFIQLHVPASLCHTHVP